MSSTEGLTEHANCKHQIYLIEEGVLCAKVVQEEYEDEPEYEIAEYGPIVEVRRIVDLFSQEPIWFSFLILSKETPIHVDVPDIAVGRSESHSCKICPEHRAPFILECATVSEVLLHGKEEEYRSYEAREILASVQQMYSGLSLMILIEALSETPPVG